MVLVRAWRLIAGGAALAVSLFAAPISAAEGEHGLSAFGDLAYPADFTHFAYADPDAPKADPQLAALLEAGPLKDVVLGDPNAETVIVEYASMTCPHCAHFYTEVFPKLKEKYIDTGKARFIFREFPLDGLAVAASMLARCAGDDRFYPMVDGLFETQETWAVAGADGKEKLDLLKLQFPKQSVLHSMSEYRPHP